MKKMQTNSSSACGHSNDAILCDKSDCSDSICCNEDSECCSRRQKRRCVDGNADSGSCCGGGGDCSKDDSLLQPTPDSLIEEGLVSTVYSIEDPYEGSAPKTCTKAFFENGGDISASTENSADNIAALYRAESTTKPT